METKENIHRGDPYITNENNASYKDVTKIIGDLRIDKNVKADLKKLTQVSGYVYVSEGATFTAPALNEVSGSVYVRQGATFTAPALMKSGSVYVRQGATINIPQTKGLTYRSIDNTLFVIESEKTSKGIKIYGGYVIRSITDGKANKVNCYVAEIEGFYAHGKTVRAAISDVQFKIVSEKLKNEPILPDTLMTAQHYRLVTGACNAGIRDWMDRHGLAYTVENLGLSTERVIEKDPIKAKDLLPMLEKNGAFGLEKFRSLLKFDN